MVRLGCVIFDDPVSHDSGWACVYGGEPFRITSTAGLDTEVVWMVNLDFETMRVSHFHRHARYRREDYLRTRMDAIVDEIGAPVWDRGACAQAIANVFGRVMRLAKAWYGIEEPPPDTLRGGLAERLFPADYCKDNLTSGALLDALQEYTQCETTPVQSAVIRQSFWLPRWQHAATLLGQPVPLPGARYVRAGRLPAGTDVLSWLQDQPQAVLLVNISHLEAGWNTLFNHGGGVARRVVRGRQRSIHRQSARRWVMAPELSAMLSLNPKANIVVHDVLLPADQPVPVQGCLPEYEPGTPAWHSVWLSYSAGLLAENVWQAAAMLHPVVRQSCRLAVSARQPILRAHDRMLCMRAAAVLRDQGAFVLGFGAGHVHCQLVSGYGYREIAAMGIQAGVMVAPGNFVSQESSSVDASGESRASLSSIEAVARHLYTPGLHRDLMEADRKAVEVLLSKPWVSPLLETAAEKQ